MVICDVGTINIRLNVLKCDLPIDHRGPALHRQPVYEPDINNHDNDDSTTTLQALTNQITKYPTMTRQQLYQLPD